MTDRWERLSQLLDELFDLDPAQREARLLAVQADDPALAADLRRALAADERSGVLDAGVAANTVMTRLAQGDAEAAAPTQSGAMVGHYRLLERVGSGGMGDVWRGERVGDDFDQQVAIKLIRPLLDSPSLRERFARERRILARLDHPNIARLLDGGVSDDGTPWYAMEFVKGVPITQYADRQQLDARARVELLLQVCDAVANAQSLLVVHRDLKPSNILVDAQGRARVLDFGIARLLDDSADVALTGTGVRVFSPAYAAPEQIRGDAVGTAADVFALGALLYELLTGEVPHPKRSAAPERLLAGLADETAPRPSRTLRDRASLATGDAARTTRNPRDVGADLDLIVSTALQPDPARRYAGAAQLADDLRRWLEGRPVAAQADTAGYRMRRFVARHRLAVGSASAVLLALVAGLGIALWQANVARDHAARADAQAERANAEATRANAEAKRAEREATLAKAQIERTKKVKEFLVSIFLQADPMRREAAGPMGMGEAFDMALERARTELAGDPVLQADVFDDFGEIRAGQGRFDESQALFEQALAVAEKEYGPDHPVVAESLVNLGAIRQYRGDSLAGEPFFARAIAILEKDDGGDPLAIANALSGMATVLQEKGDAAGMRASAERILALVRQHAPDDDQRLIVALSNLATVDQNDGRLAEAEAGLGEAIARIEKVQGVDSPHLWPSLMTLADINFIRGNLAEEAKLQRRALDIVQKTFPGDHRWVATSLVNVSEMDAREGNAAEGERKAREGIAMFERLKSPFVSYGLRRLGIIQRDQGKTGEALLSLTSAWDQCVQTKRTGETVCLTVRAIRAQLLAMQGQGELAVAETEALLSDPVLRMTAPATDTAMRSERAQAWRARAAALKAVGRRDEALAAQDRGIELLKAEFGEAHEETRGLVAEREKL